MENSLFLLVPSEIRLGHNNAQSAQIQKLMSVCSNNQNISVFISTILDKENA